MGEVVVGSDGFDQPLVLLLVLLLELQVLLARLVLLLQLQVLLLPLLLPLVPLLPPLPLPPLSAHSVTAMRLITPAPAVSAQVCWAQGGESIQAIVCASDPQ
mmetsp:Transcript_92404/g.238551  ORF Transcript_92404/g.238551 Transcript_92404/m.238551 type:complete len:102 (-) Transcript_92404:844-1149(-)